MRRPVIDAVAGIVGREEAEKLADDVYAAEDEKPLSDYELSLLRRADSGLEQQASLEIDEQNLSP